MTQKFGKTWWGQQWLKALAEIDYNYRLPRGTALADSNSVLQITRKGNLLIAQVKAGKKRIHDIRITFSKFTQQKIKKFIDNVIAYPDLVSQLLRDELNPEILEIAKTVNLRIFPFAWEDLDIYCSCHNWNMPCKHTAAVLYTISQEIDKDPFFIFDIHGINFQYELYKRGVFFNTLSYLAVPEWTTLFNLRTRRTLSTENNKLEQIEYSRLDFMFEHFGVLLSPKPSFLEKKDFKELYMEKLAKISKKASSFIDKSKDISQLLNTNVTPISRDTKIRFTAFENGHIYSEITNKDSENDITYINAKDIAAAILSVPAEKINTYHPTIVSVYQLLITAIHLIHKGGVIPKIISVKYDFFIIRWFPARMVEEVESVIKKLDDLVYPDMLYANFKDFGKPIQIENSTEHLLSWAISWLMSFFAGSCNRSKFLKMFFLLKPENFWSYKEEKYPTEIKSWLDRLNYSTVQYDLSLIVSETLFGFYIDVTVTLNRKRIYLQNILIQDDYESERDSILKETSLLIPFLDGLDIYLASNAKSPIYYSKETFETFLRDIIPAMRHLGVKVILPKNLRSLIRPRPVFRISANKKNNSGIFDLNSIFYFDVSVALGDELLTEDEFLKLTENARELVRFKDKYIYVSKDDVERLRKFFANENRISGRELLQVALSETYEHETVELTEEVRQLIGDLTKQPEVAVPKEITATLRPYQERGYAWMYRNMRIGFGSILADDMGLGKTLQVITLLQKMKNEKSITRNNAAAVIVPTGLINNWLAEITRFAPNLSVFLYHGQRRSLEHFNADILLTSYGIVRSDISILKKKKWQIVIIDEAQNIKNSDSGQSKAVRGLPASTHIALSGTPVENRLSEFWSVMDFANKGYLGTNKYFMDNFANPIQCYNDKEAVSQFRKITAPFIMRRLKTDKNIIKDLPDKIEQNEYLDLTKNQIFLYEQTIQETMKKIEELQKQPDYSHIKKSGLILKMIVELKQICDHPALYLKDGDTDPKLSGKTMYLLDLLQNIVENNQKVLVFSQFREMGKLLVPMITRRIGESPLFLHGGCSIEERKNLVNRFQNCQNERVFLLSLKAAGTGLNLTAASHVIHYDLWWNPAVEAQATDRAYRIGQHQNVLVHRFITRNTFEERIDELIQQKKHLTEMTVSTGENWIGKLSNEELLEIFERRDE